MLKRDDPQNACFSASRDTFSGALTSVGAVVGLAAAPLARADVVPRYIGHALAYGCANLPILGCAPFPRLNN